MIISLQDFKVINIFLNGTLYLFSNMFIYCEDTNSTTLITLIMINRQVVKLKKECSEELTEISFISVILKERLLQISSGEILSKSVH